MAIENDISLLHSRKLLKQNPINADLNKLVLSLYDTALDVSHWREFISGLQDALDSECAAVFLFDVLNIDWHEGMMVLSQGGDEPYWQKQLEMVCDTISAHFRERADTSPLPERFSDWFQFRFSGCEICILAVSTRKDQLCFIYVARTVGREYSDGDRALVNEILPHIRRSIHIKRQLDHNSKADIFTGDLASKLNYGHGVLDRDRRILRCNQKFSDLISLGCLVSDDGRLLLPDEGADERLQSIIKELLAAKGQEKDACKSLMLKGSDATLLMHFFREEVSFPQSLKTEALFSVLVDELAEEQIPPAEILKDLWGLTNSEVKVIRELLRDSNGKKIAQKLNVSHETVRFHIKNLFTKLNVNRQSDLIAKVLKSIGRIYRER